MINDTGGLDVQIDLGKYNRLMRKIKDKDLVAKPIKHIFSKAALLVERQAKINSPVDTGRLKNSWTHQMDTDTVPLWVKVGTNVQYAAPLEESKKRPRGAGRIPFFHPAVTHMKSRIEELLEEARQIIRDHWDKE